jgi:hypothetical protein
MKASTGSVKGSGRLKRPIVGMTKRSGHGTASKIGSVNRPSSRIKTRGGKRI